MLDRKTTCAVFAALCLAPRLAAAADVTIDRATTYQTIEGFGFFGGADVWWSSASAVLDQAWTAKVIDDLGITMWRNEYYAEGTPQDATWDKQKPVVQGLASYASQKGVKLKILLTVWSPPATLKCLSDDDSTCSSNPPTRPADTKGGNTLDPAKRADLASWLVAGAQMYHDAGADLYAVSFQNEPLFAEPYNSCVYSQSHYASTLAAIGPTLKAAFPDLKLFGSENMLGIECGKSPGTVFDPYWYTANLMSNQAALAAIDAFAVHGYVDGVSATATSSLASMWTSFRDGTAQTGKAIWMTETSGYTHTWPGTTSAPGPLDLGQAIYAALAYGNLSAWTYWQGSEKDGYTEYSLMAGATSLGKNYYVSKQFFRFIRPGAERVDVKSGDPEVMVVAFQHPTMNAFTLVALNVGSASKTINLAGAGWPADFRAFRTSASENAVDLGTVAADAITLPASSITTFVNGSYIETPGGAGTGGAGGGGGATSSGGAAGTGGRAGTGGAAATGGGIGTGGVVATGGKAETGGVQAGGGTTGNGGVMGGGGVTSGATSSGGVTSGAGGITSTTSTGVSPAATGGEMGAGGSTAAGGKSSGGCGCDVGGSARTRPAFWANLLAGLAVTAARRRRRSKRRGKGAAKTAKPNRAVDERCVPEHDQDGFPYAILRDLAALPIFDDDQAYDAKRVWQKHVSSGCGCCDLPAKDPRR
jgi:glucuronoarabinoxylan endo-1,4-beta-xylanase